MPTADHRPTVAIVSDEIGYVYVRVADAVEAEIRAGRLPYGARLPNERDMGTQYGVAPGTARRAVQELRDRGLVVTLPNKGTFVTVRQGGEPGELPGADS